jgi:pyruvate dehydrogenase complex dehydrogenase (E1) component
MIESIFPSERSSKDTIILDRTIHQKGYADGDQTSNSIHNEKRSTTTLNPFVRHRQKISLHVGDELLEALDQKIFEAFNTQK